MESTPVKPWVDFRWEPDPKPKPEEHACDECGEKGVELRKEKDVFGQPFRLCGACFSHNRKNLIPPTNERALTEEERRFAAYFGKDDYDERDRVRDA